MLAPTSMVKGNAEYRLRNEVEAREPLIRPCQPQAPTQVLPANPVNISYPYTTHQGSRNKVFISSNRPPAPPRDHNLQQYLSQTGSNDVGFTGPSNTSHHNHNFLGQDLLIGNKEYLTSYSSSQSPQELVNDFLLSDLSNEDSTDIMNPGRECYLPPTPALEQVLNQSRIQINDEPWSQLNRRDQDHAQAGYGLSLQGDNGMMSRRPISPGNLSSNTLTTAWSSLGPSHSDSMVSAGASKGPVVVQCDDDLNVIWGSGENHPDKTHSRIGRTVVPRSPFQRTLDVPTDNRPAPSLSPGGSSSKSACSDCHLEFSGEYQRGNLARHRRQKHGLVVQAFRCVSCPRSFMRQDARLKHYRRHHPHLRPGLAQTRK